MPIGDQPTSLMSSAKGTGDAPPLEVTAGAEIAAPSELVARSETMGEGPRMLLYHTNSPGASFLESQLVATGLFTPSDIDIVEMSPVVLGPSTLPDYTCVLAWTNFSPPNVVELGDSLRDYADGGGRVILATYAYSTLQDPWRLRGGIMEPGYSPLVNSGTRLTSFPRNLDFGTALTGHPLLEGVGDFTYFGNSNYVRPTLDPGALLVASDNFGVPLVAVSASDRVVGVNLFPGNVFSKSPGVFRTLANACTAQTAIDVTIDVKPGSDDNPVNLTAANGVLPVAILTTPEFDATTVDHATVEFEGASEAHSVRRTGAAVRHEEDVDGDGDTDLVLHFRIGETALGPTSTEGGLTGETFDGTAIRGVDAVAVEASRGVR